MDAKTSKAKAGRAGKSDGRAAAVKVRRQIVLTTDEDRRLVVHAAYYRVSPADLVARLIVDHLREFVVQRRGVPADPGEGPAGAGEGGGPLPGAGSAG